MSHLIPIDEVVHFDICTHVASTGAVSDADSAPTFSVYEEDTDTAILGPTSMTKRTSLTGNYRGNFTASAANGFEAGKWYSVIVSATVSTIAAKTVAMHFRVAPAESSAGVPKGDVSHFGGSAGTFSGGRPEVNTTHIAGTAWASTTLFTLASHDPGATIGTSTLTQAQVTGGAYALNSASFAFNAALDLTTTQKASVKTEADTALSDVGLTSTITGRIDVATSTRLASASYTAPLDAAGTRSAVGLASANLDTQLGALPTAAENADAVWDEALSGHLSAGSTGEALNAAGAAGDPWTTSLPGAYSSGQAGHIIGTYLDAAISTRLATSGYTAPLSASGTRTALGLASADLDAQLAALPTATENADALLNRDMSAVADTNSRSPLNALRHIRNKWSVSGTTLTVTKEDDTTSAWTSTLTTNASADPVTGSDPA